MRKTRQSLAKESFIDEIKIYINKTFLCKVLSCPSISPYCEIKEIYLHLWPNKGSKEDL